MEDPEEFKYVRNELVIMFGIFLLTTGAIVFSLYWTIRLLIRAFS